MSLTNKIHLCYINMEDLEQWIKENQLLASDFTSEKEKWKKEISRQPNFFSDTELLLIYQDILLLKTASDKQVNFLVKTYQLEYQKICQKLFQGHKNIILVTNKQWEEPKKEEKAVILFKDKESVEKNLTNWLKEITA